MKIPRHEIDARSLQAEYVRTTDALPGFIEAARRDANNLGLLITNAQHAAALASVIAPVSPDLLRWTRLAAQAHVALFTTATADSSPVTVRLGEGETARLQGPIDESLVYASRWIRAFHLALLVRDTNGLDQLCLVPDALLRASSTRSPDYYYSWVEAARLVWLQDRGAGGKILETMNLTDVNEIEFHNPDWVLDIDVPLIELLFYVHTENDDFAGALPKSVGHFKNYWSRTAENRKDSEGFLALGLLGLTAFAHEREMKFDVQSDYLPLTLVRPTAPRPAPATPPAKPAGGASGWLKKLLPKK